MKRMPGRLRVAGAACALAAMMSLSAAQSSFAAQEIDVSPTSLPFGNQEVGTTSPATQLTVSNTGDAVLAITGNVIVPNAEFTISNDNCSNQTLPATVGSCTIDFSFSPVNNSVKSGNVVIPNDDPDESPKSVPISGTGITTSVTLSPTSHDFGAVLESSMSTPEPFTVANDGSVGVNVSSTGIDDPQFTQGNASCSFPVNLPAGQQCTFDITFTPASPGSKAATLTVTSNAGPDPVDTAALSGTGASLTPPEPPATPAPAAKKKCKKGRKLKKGKCVKKKRKKR